MIQSKQTMHRPNQDRHLHDVDGMVERVVRHILVPTDMMRVHIRVGSEWGPKLIVRTEMTMGAWMT